MEPETKKTLGVLGGMGPQATALFYQRVIARTLAGRDQEHVPMLIFSHCTMPDRTEAILGGRAEELYALLLKDAFSSAKRRRRSRHSLQHLSFFRRKAAGDLQISLLNMVEETARTAAAKGITRAGILATDGTYITDCIRPP
jgi:aspartate racemase